MITLPQLFENNKRWASELSAAHPDFFPKLAAQQSPDYLWIGCADSRVPANEIVGLMPGELFVHRNIANLVIHTDMNCLSVLQYAVDILKVKHVIVCGHYGCGGVQAAMEPQPHGLVDNWLGHIRDIRQRHAQTIEAIGSERERLRRLCELNVVEQVINVANTTIVKDGWGRRQRIVIHGWIYDIADGLLSDLDVSTASPADLASLQNKQ